MAVDDKTSQKIYKDYQRGHHLPEIAQRHGVTVRQVNQAVQFETTVQTRVNKALQRQATKAAKVTAGTKGTKK